MKERISFPKGSLSFKKLNPKVKLENKIATNDIIDNFYNVKDKLQGFRQEFKTIPEFSISNNYQITFKHPKWGRFLAPIVIESNRENIKDSLNLIKERFKDAKNK